MTDLQFHSPLVKEGLTGWAEPQPSAVEWLRMLDAGDVSAVDLVDWTAARIAEVDASVHAVIAEDPEARRREAREADNRRQKGEFLPLLGLPVTIKDSIDATGLVCTGGSCARENFVPKQDATIVARLRAAGAIIMAKTNVPEYSSSYETDNAVFGRTNHPRDASRTPGGSSGGEAALLGADASIVGIGIDGGGSIRVPGHYCGIVGIRPTVGRVPDTGTWPETRDTGYRDLMCVGPMARYVEDLALLLPIIAGPDWIDPYALPVPLGEVATVKLQGLRAGFYDGDGVTEVSEGTRQAIRSAAGILRDAGAGVSEVAPPNIKEATDIFFSLAGADGGVRTRHDLQGAGNRHHVQFQTLLDGFGEPMSLPDFFDLQRRLFAFRSNMRRFLLDYDVIISPVTTGPAPKHMATPYGISQEDYYKYEAFNYVHAWALAGTPGVVVPVGEEENLPIGVQITARPYEEHVALAAARAIERGSSKFWPRMPQR